MIGALVKNKITGNIGLVIEASVIYGVEFLIKFGEEEQWCPWRDLEIMQ